MSDGLTGLNSVAFAFDLDLKNGHLVAMKHITTGILANVDDPDSHDDKVGELEW